MEATYRPLVLTLGVVLAWNGPRIYRGARIFARLTLRTARSGGPVPGPNVRRAGEGLLRPERRLEHGSVLERDPLQGPMGHGEDAQRVGCLDHGLPLTPARERQLEGDDA